MKKRLFFTAILAGFISASNLISFSQDTAAEKKLTQEKLLAEKIEALYKQAIALYDKNALKAADELFLQILKVEPEHIGAKLYLYEKIPDKIAKEKLKSPKEPPAKEQINALYKEAVSFYNNDELDKASSLFYAILELNPDYRPAQLYLREKIPDKRKASASFPEEPQKETLEAIPAQQIEPLAQPAPAQVEVQLSEEEAARCRQFATEEARMQQMIEAQQAQTQTTQEPNPPIPLQPTPAKPEE